ncbi:hypothetical protein C4588_03045 [Candidatus Parcubacteria bacterium]|nr:MAG: hypothetical protein C4588_03045 [Candidatus Parcubacteria bacterium]
MSKNKPSHADMRKMFYEIVQFAKEQGCPVTVYKNLEKVNGSNGYFSSDPKPHIKVGLKNRPWPKAIELIIHEFCHYWQWKDGFLGHKDDEGNIIYSRILAGEDVTPKEREKASQLVRISEYDCEIRTASLFQKWKLEEIFPPSEHIKSANTYNRHIVWSIGDEENEGSGIFYAKYDLLGDKLWKGETFTHFWNPRTAAGMNRIIGPITNEQREIFDAAAGVKRTVSAVKKRKKRKKAN